MPDRPIRVLTVDPGATSGICHGEPGKAPVYSLLRLPSVEEYGDRYNVLEDKLREFIIGNGVTHLYYEAPFVSERFMSVKQIELLYGYKATIRKAGAREGIKGVPVVAAQWRKVAFNSAQPPKGLDYDKRRKWWKSEAIKRCIRNGWNIESDDVAEAALLWEYACGDLVPDVAIESTPLFSKIRL